MKNAICFADLMMRLLHFSKIIHFYRFVAEILFCLVFINMTKLLFLVWNWPVSATRLYVKYAKVRFVRIIMKKQIVRKCYSFKRTNAQSKNSERS